MTIDELRAELAGTDAALARIGGCSDGYCMISGPAKGMGTNGRCRCVRDHEARRALLVLQRLRGDVRRFVNAN